MEHPQLDISYMEVSINGGTPKSSILMRFPRTNHPFWGTPFLETPIQYGSSEIVNPLQTEMTSKCEVSPIFLNGGCGAALKVFSFLGTRVVRNEY